MCVDKILSLLRLRKKNKPTLTPTPTPTPVPGQVPVPEPSPKPLTIPNPEEAPDYSKTVDNTDLNSAVEMWKIKYNVPAGYRDFWKTYVSTALNVNIAYPAGTSKHGCKRQLNIRPEWVNPGVIAHEQAHNSYALLTKKQQVEFSKAYTRIKTTDPLIIFLYSKNPYGTCSDVEGHAEVYRYLGDEMPEVLKKYYPKLF